MSKEARALEWIVGLLRDLGVPFQTAGGLAARAYGGKRELADFDFYVPTGELGKVSAAVNDYLVRPPLHHQDQNWDITFMKIDYEGQKIELGGADDASFFNRSRGVWEPVTIDFDGSVACRVFDIEIPVMPFDELVAYKRALDREVDRRDLEEMEPW
jgi:hypothetical protein